MHFLEKGLSWSYSLNGELPSNSVVGGFDVGGERLYVGKALHCDAIIPGKIVPSHRVCYIANRRREQSCTSFYALCSTGQTRLTWIPVRDGSIPDRAILGGLQINGDQLYIGQASHNGSMVIGKVNPKYAACFIPFGSEVIPCRTYKILAAADD